MLFGNAEGFAQHGQESGAAFRDVAASQLPMSLDFHHTGPVHDFDVVRDGGDRHGENLSELADAEGILQQKLSDAPAGFLAEGMDGKECGSQGHVVSEGAGMSIQPVAPLSFRRVP